MRGESEKDGEKPRKHGSQARRKASGAPWMAAPGGPRMAAGHWESYHGSEWSKTEPSKKVISRKRKFTKFIKYL